MGDWQERSWNMGPFLVQRPYRSPQVLLFNLTALCSCALHDCTVVLFRVQISHTHVNHATAPKAPDYNTCTMWEEALCFS